MIDGDQSVFDVNNKQHETEECKPTWEAAMQIHATALAHDPDNKAAWDEIVACGRNLDRAQDTLRRLNESNERAEKLGGFTKSPVTLVQIMAQATEDIRGMCAKYADIAESEHTGIAVRDMTQLVINNAMSEAYIAYLKRITKHVVWLKDMGEYDAKD